MGKVKVRLGGKMLKISWWLMVLVIGVIALHEYAEKRYKNANLLFFVFDIGALTSLLLAVIRLLIWAN